jgi:hypothetical protein
LNFSFSTAAIFMWKIRLWKIFMLFLVSPITSTYPSVLPWQLFIFIAAAFISLRSSQDIKLKVNIAKLEIPSSVLCCKRESGLLVGDCLRVEKGINWWFASGCEIALKRYKCEIYRSRHEPRCLMERNGKTTTVSGSWEQHFIVEMISSTNQKLITYTQRFFS